MDKEYLKEAIKVEMEYLKLSSFFILALITGNISLILKVSYSQNQNNTETFLLLFGIIILIAFIFISSFIIFSIQKNLKQLKQ